MAWWRLAQQLAGWLVSFCVVGRLMGPTCVYVEAESKSVGWLLVGSCGALHMGLCKHGRFALLPT